MIIVVNWEIKLVNLLKIVLIILCNKHLLRFLLKTGWDVSKSILARIIASQIFTPRNEMFLLPISFFVTR